MNRKKVILISAISTISFILIILIVVFISKKAPDNINQNQQSIKILLKAKARDKTLKFMVSFENFKNEEFYIEKVMMINSTIFKN